MRVFLVGVAIASSVLGLWSGGGPKHNPKGGSPSGTPAACPCALGMTTPISLTTGVGSAPSTAS